MSADERNTLQREIDSQADHFLSDGEFPSTWQGGTHINLGRLDDYASFKLLVPDPAAWSEASSTLGKELAIKIETVPLSVIEGKQTVPGDKAGLLVRPDGLIAWEAKSVEDLTPEQVSQALRNVLKPALNDTAPHKIPLNSNLSREVVL
jgi:hypothetical protein